jgi:hypothetical protein
MDFVGVSLGCNMDPSWHSHWILFGHRMSQPILYDPYKYSLRMQEEWFHRRKTTQTDWELAPFTVKNVAINVIYNKTYPNYDR